MAPLAPLPLQPLDHRAADPLGRRDLLTLRLLPNLPPKPLGEGDLDTHPGILAHNGDCATRGGSFDPALESGAVEDALRELRECREYLRGVPRILRRRERAMRVARDRGLTLQRIGTAAGLSTSQVSRILSEGERRVSSP